MQMVVTTLQALFDLLFVGNENEDRAQGKNRIISTIDRKISHVPFMYLETGRPLANNIDHHLADLETLDIEAGLMQRYGEEPGPDP
jgi:hypothetical protein